MRFILLSVAYGSLYRCSWLSNEMRLINYENFLDFINVFLLGLMAWLMTCTHPAYPPPHQPVCDNIHTDYSRAEDVKGIIPLRSFGIMTRNTGYYCLGDAPK